MVDGDASARRDVKSACEQDGYQVLEADSAAEALRLHTSAHPSLILLEVIAARTAPASTSAGSSGARTRPRP